jgi:hypothetical protein
MAAIPPEGKHPATEQRIEAFYGSTPGHVAAVLLIFCLLMTTWKISDFMRMEKVTRS